MNIYSPTILGPGILITEKPSDPLHAVRLKELSEFATMQVVEYKDETFLSIPKRAQHNIVQVFDSNSQMVTPESLTQVPSKSTIEIRFLEPQSGYILIFTVGNI